MKKKGLTIWLAAVFILLGTVTGWARTGSSDIYTYESFHGTPGHKGEAYAGKFYMDSDDGYPRAFYEEGNKRQVKNTWVCMDRYKQGNLEGEYWYYFPDTNFVPNRWKQLNDRWYYFDRDGAVSGWYKDNGQYYYFDPAECYMWTSGDVERDGVLYTIGKDGISRVASELGYSGSIAAEGGDTGWSEEGGKICFLRGGQKVRSEWLDDRNQRYYIGADGYLTKGTAEVDGAVYSFAYTDGHMETEGTGYYNKQKYQFGADGKGVPLEMTVEEKIRQSDVVSWMKATYAIYSMDAEAAQLMGASYDVKELLLQDWGITDRDSGLAMIDQLEASAGAGSDKDGKAWDYSRAMLLCSSLREAGFITQEEQVTRQLQMAPSIQRSFSSWDDFNAHYLNGFSSWAYAVGRGDSVARRKSWYDYLKKISNNPFLIDWNLKLEKQW